MNFDFKTLLLQTLHSNILLLTLNRPEVKNAINSEMMQELKIFWEAMQESQEHICCIIITGADNAFCAGADLKERFHMPLEIWQAHHAILRQAFFAMIYCPIPVIAAVNGPAYGGGLELILAADFAYANKTATFAQSETKVGLIPGAFGTQSLTHTAGLKRAKELIYTASTFKAKEAYDWGIVNKICEANTLLDETLKTAQQISHNAPLAIREAKKSINFATGDIKAGADFELASYRKILLTEDRLEGIRAFNEKRVPMFKGE